MKSALVLTMASVWLTAAPAFADNQAHFEILDSTFQGACGGVDPIINTIGGNPVIDLIFPDLRVETDEHATTAHKLCNVRVHVKIESGYKLALSGVFYQGKAEIDRAGGSGNVSARAFFLGLPGVDGFRRFSAGENGNFQVDASDGSPDDTVCGSETYLNLLVDMTARGRLSEVAIQRGVGVAGPPGESVIRCPVQTRHCGR